MGKHADLLARHRKVMPEWQALYYEQPLALTHGEGRTVWDAEGNEYLDWFGGILTTSTAHALPEVVTAVTEQAERISHTSTLYLIEPAIELAEEIIALAPVEDARVFFTSSGTEANEAAMLIATLARKSDQVLAMRGSYHGRSFGAMAITGNRAWRASSLSPINVSYAEGSDPYRGAFSHLAGDPDAYIEACVKDLRRTIATTTSGDVACLIAEPIQGVGGFATPPDGLFGALKTVLDEYGILFFSDEVQTGWGRTGEHFWGIEAHGVRPDIITFAKGLGNGLSIGGVIASAKLMNSISAGSISTFGGNPLSTAGSLANLRYIRANNLQENCRVQGTEIIDRLRTAAKSMPIIGDVRGKGLMFAVELVQPGTDTPDAAAASMALEACRERGLLIGKGGLFGNVLRMAPLMTTTAEDVELGSSLLLDAIAEVQQALHGIATPAAESTPAATRQGAPA